MSQNDELATKQVDTADTKISKLEAVLNQARIGFYSFLTLTGLAYGYGVVADSEPALAIGDKLVLPVIGWLGMYVANLVNKSENK